MKSLVSLFFALCGLNIMLNLCQAIDLQKLINSMSIEEKCGQMTQLTFSVIQKSPMPTDPDENPVDYTKLVYAIRDRKVGSIINVPYDSAVKAETWQKIISIIQDVALNESLKIPVIYGLDSIHGANYVREAVLFPQPISMAASFNIEIARKVGEITALETRAVGIPWNFNPSLDIARQPLWPRFYETYGEDVYLSSKMGLAYIEGSQGDNLKNRTKVATCLKHYIGYSYPLNGRDRSVAWIPEIILREYFLPPFAAGVKAKSPTAMINSGDVNGMPGHANSFYINDILKEELKFDGFVVSDWSDINKLYSRHRVASSPEEAVRIAIMAGVDMSMVPLGFTFTDYCINISNKDSQFLERVNDANLRILKVKDNLGLFENAYPFKEDLQKINTQESNDFNLEAARESVVLAKNENNTLPLNPNQKILVTGPTSDLLRVLSGGWSYTWQGAKEDFFQNYGYKKYTLFEAISNKSPSNVVFSQGADFNTLLNINETLDLASKSDVVVLCIGELTYTETPGNIGSLMIDDNQNELANLLSQVGKPIVVIYLGGRPRTITQIVDKSSAVVLGMLPGNRGSEAIADILFGDYNPNARLPFTYPLYTNSFVHYDLKPLEGADSNYYVNLFPFAHGLSYTQFLYSDLTLSTSTLTAPNSLTVSVKVKNVGARAGKEVVILYLQDEVGSVSRPLKQVKRFTKISLQPNEEKQVVFELQNEDLSFINYSNKRVVEDGFFDIYVYNLSARFEYQNSNVSPTVVTQPTTTTPRSSAVSFSKSSSVLLFVFVLTILIFILF